MVFNTPSACSEELHLYVDEFQNFATESFASILSEARKYRLSLILAHQFIAQLDEAVRDAVFGNVGTLVCFRIGTLDADLMEKEFRPAFYAEDLSSPSKYQIYLKLMINGVAGRPFSATTLAPVEPTGNPADPEKVILVSRERYSKKISLVEDKIYRWSGVEK